MTEQLQKDVFINEDLRYFQLTNIFFDRPLNEEDIITLKEVFFSINNISQIYFKDTFDLKGIEIVKSVLEISPTMEDALVEKYILNASTLDKNKLLNMNFSNIDTWFISYKENENSFSIITIDKYREEVNLINRITSAINTSSSPVEKIMHVYDFCKKLNYKDNAPTTLLDILKTNEINKSGYAYVFNELLNTIGIKSFMAESITDNSNSFVNLVKVDDDKYKTKVFKNTAENWITNALSEDIKQAEEVRSILNYTLKEKHEIDLNEFVENSIKSDELKESFKEHMEDKGLDESFNIDKKWVEKKLKKRGIKTDNGFDIKADLTDFEDPMKYSVRQNPDGSIDIVIKNVRFYEEK